MKIIYSGLESSGKSLKLAMVASDVAWRNSKWKEKSGIVRPIWSNIKFSESFYDLVTKEYGIPVFYWENLDDLIKITNADVLIDEVGNYFDSRLWADLSLDVRRWLTQGAKMGIEIYGSAQDFAQVDKAFRRLVNELYHITKLAGSPRPAATRPPVTRIWGLCHVKPLDPQGYDEDKSKFKEVSLFSLDFFLIRKEYCDLFDTTQKIERSKPPKMKHIERECELDNCGIKKLQHV